MSVAFRRRGAAAVLAAVVAFSTFIFPTPSASADSAAGGTIVIDGILLGPPAAPDLTITDVNSGAVSVAWELANDGGGTISSYRLEYKRDWEDTWWKAVDFPAGEFEAVLSDLDDFVLWDFRIRAENEHGPGDWSEVSSAMPPGIPSFVTNVVDVEGDGSLTLRWSMPDYPGFGEFLGFMVSGPIPDPCEPYELADEPGRFECVISGLQNGTKYLFQLAAVSEKGTGQTMTIPANPFGPPFAPPVSVSDSETSSTVTWEEADGNGRPVSFYEVLVDGEVVEVVPAGDDYSFTLSDLTPGETYVVGVRAVNSGNAVGEVAEVTAAPYTVPDAPALSVVPGDEVIHVVLTPGSGNGRPITAYHVYVNGELWGTLPGDTTSFTVTQIPASGDDTTPLQNGVSYIVEVYAENEAGLSPTASAPGTPYGVPSAPADVSVSDGDGEFTVSWEPADPNGRPITSYRVYVDGALVGEVAGDVFEFTVEAGNGGSYDVEVAAVNLWGEGEASSPVVAEPYGVPDAPVLEVEARDGALELSWTAPSSNGRPVTEYVIYLGDELIETVAYPTSFFVVDGLENGTEYEVAVSAVNLRGEGPASPPQTASPLGHAFAPEVSLSEGDGELSATWTVPDGNGSPVSGFKVWLNGDPYGELPADVTKLTLGGLTNGETYLVEVAAITEAGEGLRGSASGVPFGTPVVADLEADALDGAVRLSWVADGNGRPVTSYQVFVDGRRVADLGSGTTSYVVEGLTNGRSYVVEVAAVTEWGVGKRASVVATPHTSPSSPKVEISPIDSGFRLSWSVDDDGTPVSKVRVVVSNPHLERTVNVFAASGSYDFTDLEPGEYSVTVTVVTEAGLSSSVTLRYVVSPTSTKFKDVGGSVFEADIEWLAASGITRGCNPPNNTLFCPDRPVTRAEVAAFLDRYFIPPDAEADVFDDDDGHFFEAELSRVGAAGILRGCNPPDNNLVCPDDLLTRGEAAAAVVRAFGLDTPQSSPFVDTDGHRFSSEIAALAAARITRGCNPPTGDRYCPDRPLTRAEFAAFLHRAAQLDS